MSEQEVTIRITQLERTVSKLESQLKEILPFIVAQMDMEEINLLKTDYSTIEATE